MKYTALGIGYPPQERDAERSEWTGYGLDFDFATSVEEAKSMLQRGNYVCVAIRAHDIGPEEVFALRQVKAIPMIILPPCYSAAEAHMCAHFSAIQYIRASGYGEMVIKDSDDSLKYGLQIAAKEPEALTIVTVKDLSFCLEHRSVEIRGEEIPLTEKEFDILALLLSNPKKVFTHEMIMDAVWHEDISFYSSKAVTTHISNLRRKLKTAPDIPEYIKSVHGVGYKFCVPE